MSRDTEEQVSFTEQDANLSSPSSSQSTGSDWQTTQEDEESSVFNLFVCVTNSKSNGKNVTVQVSTFKRKHNDNPHGNAKVLRHTGMESVSPSSSGYTEPEETVEEEQSIQDVVLAQVLRRECPGLSGLAKAWVRTYRSSQYEAIRSMLELILHTTGVMLSINKEQAMRLDQLTIETYNEWMSDPENRALILENRFIRNLLKFLKLTLTREVCLNDMLIMRRIQYLLNLFSKSTWVSTRYAALILGSLITVQYAEYIAELKSDLDDVLATGFEASVRGEIAVAKDLFEQFIEVVNVCQRDVVYTIRKLACDIFCNWCSKEEPLLMADNHLRYLYFAIYDESPSIRRLAILTSGKLCRSQIVYQNLPLFVEKFLNSVFKRVLDVNDRVVSVSLDAIAGIQRSASWLLNGFSLENVFKLIFSEVEWKSAKAAELLYRFCDSMSTNNVALISNILLFIEECLEEIGKGCDKVYVIKLVLKNLFPWSHQKLTDWSAWRRLLHDSRERSEKFQEVTGLVIVELINLVSLNAGDRFFAESDFPPIPKLNENESTANEQLDGNADVRLKRDCLNYLVSMTSVFAPQLLQIWKEYQRNEKCLLELIKIPQYFNGEIDSFDMKLICSYLVGLRNEMSSSPSMDAIHRSLACIYHLMSASQKWKPSIPKLEKVLFKPVIENFFDACKTLTQQHIQKPAKVVALKVVKQALYLSKYFDVTKTSLLEDSFKILRLGCSKEKPNAELVCPMMMMCLYILEWQLKTVVEQPQTVNSMNARLNKIESQGRLLFNHLQSLLTDERTIVREMSYSTMCKLLTTFSSFNVYAEPFPRIHLPPPQLEVAEWINYVMECQSPTVVPPDEEKFKSSTSALKLFCSLLKVQALDMLYMSTALHFFLYHNQTKNYNDILLSTFQALASSKDFSKIFVDSLVWVKSRRSSCNVEEIAKGFCCVVLPSLSPRGLFRKVTYEIISYGMFCIRNQSHFFIFKALAYFIKLYDMKNVLLSIELKVLQSFPNHLESDDVKNFLTTILERRLELTRRGPLQL